MSGEERTHDYSGLEIARREELDADCFFGPPQVSPRLGGEADKVGNRYEGAWTIHHVLKVIHGSGRSITVEGVGELADGAEFVYTRSNGGTEAHQLKRQNGTANTWTVSSLRRLKIWESALDHVKAGREYHFTSILPAITLQDICDRARQANDLEEFVTSWLTNQPLRAAFNQLSSAEVFGSPEKAWIAIRGIWIEWHDERNLVQNNAFLASLLLDGATGHLAALALGDMILNSLGVRMTKEFILLRLEQHNLSLATSARSGDLQQRVHAITERWIAAVGRDLIEPPLQRSETQVVSDLASGNGTRNLIFVMGAAGSGKSAALSLAVRQILNKGIKVLGFRLDRLEEFASSEELGSRLGLSSSPVASLAASAHGERCVLVIDQLDVVSLASGRMPNSFDAVAEIVLEATNFPELKVILACREFDVNNDYRIRALRESASAECVAVSKLSDAEIDSAVGDMGFDATGINAFQREILRTPLNLLLLASLVGEPNAIEFQTTARLFDAYWERKRRAVHQRRAGARFSEVVATAASAISRSQRLAVPDTIFDHRELADDADVLISEHVLTKEGGQIAFFHQSFFDYAFARSWATQGGSLVGLLTESEQELFRRAQVRQVLFHLRGRDFSRYLEEISSILSSIEVRFHIKAVVVAVLAAVADPTSSEADVVIASVDGNCSLAKRTWERLRSLPWFTTLDLEGRLEQWLNGDGQERDRALGLLVAGARDNPDRVAEILDSKRGNTEYYTWLRWICRFADLHASRQLFDLFIDAVQNGNYDGHEGDMWLSALDLSENQPVWAVELCVAFLVGRPGSLPRDPDGDLAILRERDYGASELIKDAARLAPSRFIDGLLPYMLSVMNVSRGSGPIVHGYPSDPYFSDPFWSAKSSSKIADALMFGMGDAISRVAAEDASGVRQQLQGLALQKFAGAQWLLYQGLIAGASNFASWATELVNEEIDRLFCGPNSNPVWVTSLLLRAIAPHVNPDEHESLEFAVRDVRFSFEGRSGGFLAFTLLSGLDETRLTALGRRRLGEYRRKFNQLTPDQPPGVVSGFVQSPISGASAGRMTDRNWLQAMARHDSDEHDWATFKGGARELSQMLQQQTKVDPVRFAKLALSTTSSTHPAYSAAILMGLADSSVSPDEQESVFDAVRHISGLQRAENDRWLGAALRNYLRTTPIDIVETIRDRALGSPDPADDSPLMDSEEREPGDRLRMAGINCARGALAQHLGDLLVYDVDGSRTAAVVPMLVDMASDSVLAVRSQVAHTIAATLRYGREAATHAFWILIDTDDSLLASEFVRRLIRYIGNGADPIAVLPVVERMLASDEYSVRQSGGELAAVAALEWSLSGPLDSVMNGSDEASRKGLARACALGLSETRNVSRAAAVLCGLFTIDGVGGGWDPPNSIGK